MGDPVNEAYPSRPNISIGLKHCLSDITGTGLSIRRWG